MSPVSPRPEKKWQPDGIRTSVQEIPILLPRNFCSVLVSITFSACTESRLKHLLHRLDQEPSLVYPKFQENSSE